MKPVNDYYKKLKLFIDQYYNEINLDRVKLMLMTSTQDLK